MKHKTNRSIFNQNLEKIRKSKGLTLNELAKISGLTQRMIFYYENQAINPPIDKIEILAKALDVSISDLLGTPETENTKDNFLTLDTRTLKKIKMILSLSKQERHIIYDLAETFHRKKRKKQYQQKTLENN
ncbi:helix-turn-helix transcriptional regulator [Candidatus Woesearchaeota archaeon]|nr:helix-turn-helix transcriptional regulator [Candidatus Woesearchaeota archaeon]